MIKTQNKWQSKYISKKFKNIIIRKIYFKLNLNHIMIVLIMFKEMKNIYFSNFRKKNTFKIEN
jgi:hypothetical protein